VRAQGEEHIGGLKDNLTLSDGVPTSASVRDSPTAIAISAIQPVPAVFDTNDDLTNRPVPAAAKFDSNLIDQPVVMAQNHKWTSDPIDEGQSVVKRPIDRESYELLENIRVFLIGVYVGEPEEIQAYKECCAELKHQRSVEVQVAFPMTPIDTAKVRTLLIKGPGIAGTNEMIVQDEGDPNTTSSEDEDWIDHSGPGSDTEGEMEPKTEDEGGEIIEPEPERKVIEGGVIEAEPELKVIEG
jgi:hypothetical protein